MARAQNSEMNPMQFGKCYHQGVDVKRKKKKEYVNYWTPALCLGGQTGDRT